MPSKIKTLLISGTVALVAVLGAVGAAEAGGRYHMPFAPFNSYMPGAYDDDYDTGTYSYGDRYGDEVEDAVSAAARIARKKLGVDVEDMLDYVDE
jgi:hypothetical protein